MKYIQSNLSKHIDFEHVFDCKSARQIITVNTVKAISTHLTPVFRFYTPWKRQEPLFFSIFRGCRNCTFAVNSLTSVSSFVPRLPVKYLNDKEVWVQIFLHQFKIPQKMLYTQLTFTLQSQQQKYKKVWNMFKVNYKETRPMSMTSFWCLHS